MWQSGDTWTKRVTASTAILMQVVHRNTIYRPTNNLELTGYAPQYALLAEPDSRARKGPVPVRLVPVGQANGRARGELVTAAVHEQPPWSEMFHDLIHDNSAPRKFFHWRGRISAILARVLHGAGSPCFARGGVASPSVNGAASAVR